MRVEAALEDVRKGRWRGSFQWSFALPAAWQLLLSGLFASYGLTCTEP